MSDVDLRLVAALRRQLGSRPAGAVEPDDEVTADLGQLGRVARRIA